MMNKTGWISGTVIGVMMSVGAHAQPPQVGTDEPQASATRAAEQRMQRFEDLDSNGDGNLSFEEFRAAPLAAFGQQDADGDGTLNRQEALQHRFRQLDADEDGKLSADEIARGRGMAAPQREGQGAGQGPRGGQDGDGRMRNMTPEEREQMRQRMQQMTPEQRERMREQMPRGGRQQGSQGPQGQQGRQGQQAPDDPHADH